MVLGNEGKKYLQHVRKPNHNVLLDESHVFVSKGAGCEIHFYRRPVLLASGDVGIPQTS